MSAVGSVPAQQRVLLRRSMRGLWSHLPLLTLASAAVCGSACVAALVAPGATPFSVVVMAMLVAPAAAAIGAVANAVVGVDDATFRQWWRACVVGVRHGIPAVLPLAVAGALFLVAVQVWQRTGQPVVLASVGVSGAVMVGLLPLTAAMLHLVTGLPHLGRTAQWRTAVELSVRWPVRFLAAPVLLAFGAWLATQLSASLLLLAPAPAGLVGAAAFWTSAVETGRLSIEFTENDVLERESV